MYRESWTLSDTLVHDIMLAGGFLVAIDTVISPTGWEVQVFARKERDRTRLRELLQRLEVPFEEDGRFVFPTRFSYAEELTRIHSVVRDLVCRIADSDAVGRGR